MAEFGGQTEHRALFCERRYRWPRAMRRGCGRRIGAGERPGSCFREREGPGAAGSPGGCSGEPVADGLGDASERSGRSAGLTASGLAGPGSGVRKSGIGGRRSGRRRWARGGDWTAVSAPDWLAERGGEPAAGSPTLAAGGPASGAAGAPGEHRPLAGRGALPETPGGRPGGGSGAATRSPRLALGAPAGGAGLDQVGAVAPASPADPPGFPRAGGPPRCRPPPPGPGRPRRTRRMVWTAGGGGEPAAGHRKVPSDRPLPPLPPAIGLRYPLGLGRLPGSGCGGPDPWLGAWARSDRSGPEKSLSGQRPAVKRQPGGL